jgi:hypothetical protein
VTKLFRRFVVRCAVSLAAALVAGCATMAVHSYAERGARFPTYTTYAWGPIDQHTTGDARLDNNPFFQERIQADVDRLMSRRGFQKAAVGHADLVVHYHANIAQRVDVNGVDREYGYCQGDDCRPYVTDVGTLTIDLVDSRTNRLVWRGWAEGTVDGVVDDQSWMEHKVDDAVTRIVESIPRR